MISVRKLAVTAVMVAVVAVCAAAQDKAAVVTAAGSKLGPVPGLPGCAKMSAQRGDPTKGGAVLLVKTTAGCKIPRHWHSASESLIIVSGKAKAEMKADTPASSEIGPGDYIYMPSKHVHQFTSTTTCTFFVVTEAAFDIHYVDKDGKEIPPEQALGPAKKPAAAKPAPTKK